MNSTSKHALAVVIAAVLAVGVYGGYKFLLTPQLQLSASSPTGSTFNTAKLSSINMTPTSASGTSTSILNNDANDRVVTDGFATCTGLTNMFAQTSAGVAAFTIQAATTSTNAPGNLPSIGLAAINMSVATTSSDGYNATTTYTNVFSRRWNAGSYMTFTANATSAAAACTVGVHYLST